jgi:hypothetical protein
MSIKKPTAGERLVPHSARQPFPLALLRKAALLQVSVPRFASALTYQTIHITRNTTATMNLCISTLALLLLSRLPVAGSYPTGAGGCEGGVPAVGGSHLTNPVTNGSLADGGYTLTLNGENVTDGSIVIAQNVQYTLAVEGAADYLGILYRLAPDGSEVDTSGYLLPSDSSSTQAAPVCQAPVQGVTHTSAISKNKVEALLEVDALASFVLDITVVGENDSDNSEYYYSQYKVMIEAAPSAVSNGGDGAAPTPSTTQSDSSHSSSFFTVMDWHLTVVLLVASLALA